MFGYYLCVVIFSLRSVRYDSHFCYPKGSHKRAQRSPEKEMRECKKSVKISWIMLCLYFIYQCPVIVIFVLLQFYSSRSNILCCTFLFYYPKESINEIVFDLYFNCKESYVFLRFLRRSIRWKTRDKKKSFQWQKANKQRKDLELLDHFLYCRCVRLVYCVCYMKYEVTFSRKNHKIFK